MLYKGTIMAGASGSFGGLTASHNRAGTYFRARATPTNPNTSYQQEVRSIMGALAAYWGETLTQAQRDLWDLYALNVPKINRVGDPINVGGLGMFMRTNVPCLQTGAGGGAIIATAPSVFNLGSYTPPEIAAITAATEMISLTFDDTDEWANEDDSDMVVFTSRPMSPAINYFKGPYRFAGLIAGDSITPPTSPANITSPWELEVDQKVGIRVAVLRADGRYSSPFRGTGVSA
jgi:hypothetical protein